ncbi:MAG: bifunctional folylpolyglutamate synthase/dihydrofolate synthase [Acidobacteria bacterium]|nr:bifunctional folylpolyglutamate synthase/dihydrofolate synthase [Acidobacteriota bacterium]MCW5948844.1 bifunctional folylpolyglutamate synthase/dihydrofolate synthase [Pyrinomonadaceae bacterium]
MDLEETTRYLYSLGNEVEAMKLGLENIRVLLSELGNPQKSYFKVQVAGTNGKGSVCACLDSICRQAGIRTGLYTSPHLISITERIRVGGTEIGDENFAKLAARVRELAETLLDAGRLEYRPTFFEQVTAIGLLAFAEAGVELAILETGLGGRLDAVTAAAAEIAAITKIDLDHQEYLGDTLEEIAAEKAAIVTGSTEAVVIGRQRPAAMEAIRDRIGSVGLEPRRVRECAVVFDESSLGNPIRTLPAETGLLGRHQYENAEVAILTAQILRERFTITDEQIRSGLRAARHPGRLEYIGDLLFDGAHNLGGAEALREFVVFNEKRPLTILFGAMADKDVRGMLAVLAPLAERIVLTESTNSRSASFESLLAALPEDVSNETVFVTDNVAKALAIAREITPTGGIVLVTGSLYLVGEAKAVTLREQT